MLLLLVMLVFVQAAQADPPRILILGDSISAAHGMATEAGWPALLGERLAARGHPHEVVNASIGGDTTSGARSRLPAELERHDPAIVILQIGGNDGLRGLSPQAMERNLDAMIEQARAAGSRVLLAAIRLPPNYGDAYVSRFREAYARVAERHDIAFLPRILAGFEDRRELMLEDGIHPSAAGQHRVLDNVWAILEPMLAGH